VAELGFGYGTGDDWHFYEPDRLVLPAHQYAGARVRCRLITDGHDMPALSHLALSYPERSFLDCWSILTPHGTPLPDRRL